MKAVRSLAALALMSAAFALPAEAGTLKDDIVAANSGWAADFNSGNAEGVAARYTEDGAVFPPDGPRTDGRAAIQAFWKGAIDAGLTNVTLTTVEVEAGGDFAYEVGTLSLDAPDKSGGVTMIKGKYVVVWKKGSDGTWRLYRDIWNADPAK